MADRLDTVDRRILYRLVADARNTSAPDIADEVNVSAGTVRNRIDQLESAGVIEGYHAHIDYERAEGRLTNLFVCTSSVAERERHAKQVAEIPGVVGVRRLLTGRENLHVTGVAEDMEGLTRIARRISEVGVEIEGEDLVEGETVRPYHQFGPGEDEGRQSIADFMSLSAGAEVVELTVSADAPVAGISLGEANEEGVFGEEVLVVSVERGEEILAPRGDTELRPDDLVTLFCRDGADDATLAAFAG